MPAEQRYCKTCNEKVDHIGIIVKSHSAADMSRKSKFKAFMSVFVAGLFAVSETALLSTKSKSSR